MSGTNPVQFFITGVIGCLLPGLTMNVIPNDCLLEDPLLDNKDDKILLMVSINQYLNL